MRPMVVSRRHVPGRGLRPWILMVVPFLLTSACWADPPTAAKRMTERIDELLAARMGEEGVTPAATASDTEFLRRVSLDLTGVIPEVIVVRKFLASKAPAKRAELVELLLNKPRHATHFANLWRNVMLPDDSNVRRFGGDAGFQSWLQGEFADNTPYNEMVSELLLTEGNYRSVGPQLFYAALELKPEDLAASTSRIFLGVQIQCAQCHDHPFDHWTRDDFWSYAAFFAHLQRPQGQQRIVTQIAEADDGEEIKIPDTGKVALPRFLRNKGSANVAATGEGKRRERLAKWLTSGENPYFAKATVNRIWAVLFGRGIVDPVDDLGAHNLPSHPQLLDELAEYFVESGFDVRQMIRTLTATRAYQRSSRTTGDQEEVEDRPELFARMAVKSLTAEQLYDCLSEAMRRRERATTNRQFAGFRGFDQNREAFLAKFRAPTQGATEFQSGIPQALTLMNGRDIREATDLATSDILNALEVPLFSDADRVEMLFLSTVSRYPTEKEREVFLAHVHHGSDSGNRREALSDILWALLNSAEFALNH